MRLRSGGVPEPATMMRSQPGTSTRRRTIWTRLAHRGHNLWPHQPHGVDLLLGGLLAARLRLSAPRGLLVPAPLFAVRVVDLIVIWCFVDNFRRRDHHGLAKALWFLFIVFIPIIGVLCYLIPRPATVEIE